MSIIEKISKIINDGDTAGAEQLIHDDYQFLMHSSGKSLTKKDVVGWVSMKDVKKNNVRVLFENDQNMSADPKFIELQKKMKNVFKEGTIQDEMRVVFND